MSAPVQAETTCCKGRMRNLGSSNRRFVVLGTTSDFIFKLLNVDFTRLERTDKPAQKKI